MKTRDGADGGMSEGNIMKKPRRPALGECSDRLVGFERAVPDVSVKSVPTVRF